MIRRKRYLNRIKPFVDKPLIKVITGIRRCGKSTLMNQLMGEIEKNGIRKEQIISINKELYEYDFLRTYNDLHKYVNDKASANYKKYYLFIDEVQEIEQWEKAVTSFLTEKKYDIYISGSNARLLSSEIATLLSGRYIEFKIYTLSFSEFSELYSQKKKRKNADVFSDYIKYGGFPGLHNLDWEEENLRQYLESIYSTIVLKDVVMRNQLKDVAMLKNILEFMAVNCGNITTAKSIRDYSKSQNRTISTDTVLNYIQYAIDALLMHQVRRFDIQGKKVLEIYEKYYLNDVGLGFAMIGNSASMISGKLENIIFLELLSRGYKVTIGKNKEKEINFIASLGQEKIYIQVCTSLLGNSVVEREFGAFNGVNNHYPKLVLSLDEYNFGTDFKGIQWKNIKDFLLKK
jgi:hypothetical protein